MCLGCVVGALWVCVVYVIVVGALIVGALIVCGCVCNPWNHRDPFGFVRLTFSLYVRAGGARDRASLALTKTLALVCEINPGSLPVPLGNGTLGRRVAPPSVQYTLS